MKRLLSILAALAALCTNAAARDASVSAPSGQAISAQSVPAADSLSTLSYGLDAGLDSLHIAKIRAHMDSIRQHRPTVAAVFSGGGAKSAAQIGAIKLLQEKGIPIDLMIGSSLGGYMAGVYALGYDGPEIEEIMGGMDWEGAVIELQKRRELRMDRKLYRDRFQVSLPFGKDSFGVEHNMIPMGVFHAQNLRNNINSIAVGYSHDIDFLDLPTPLVTVSTDIITAHPKIWMSGNVTDAMVSTFSVPGLFVPTRRHGMILSDGAFTNNYPAQTAEELGADIIIGLDVAAPRATYDEIRNGVNVFMQVFDMLGMDPFRESYSHIDLNIRANLDGYDMLNFDRESIDTLLRRGNESMEVYESAVDSLARVIGAAGEPRARKAIDLSKEKVAVAEVEFRGVPDAPALMRRLGIEPDGERLIDKADLDKIANRLRSGREYVSVVYSVLGEEAPYKVVFDCIQNPRNVFGVGLRVDTKEYASALLNVGIGTIGTGHSLDVNARLGLKTALDAEYSYRTAAGIDPFIRANALYYAHCTMRSQGARKLLETNFFNGGASIGATTRLSNWFGAEIAAATECYILGGYSLPSVKVYAAVRGDTFDNATFPTKGLRYAVQYDHYLSDYSRFLNMYSALGGDLEGAITIANALTFHPHAGGRYIFTGGREIPFYFTNSLSVGYDGRSFAHQRAFIGLNDAFYFNGNCLVTAGLDMQLRIADKHYISLLSSFGDSAYGVRGLPHGLLFAGAGVQYGMDFVLGSLLRADVHWSTLTGFGAYLALGLDF